MLFLYVILKNKKEGNQPFFLPSGHQNYPFLEVQAFPETMHKSLRAQSQN